MKNGKCRFAIAAVLLSFLLACNSDVEGERTGDSTVNSPERDNTHNRMPDTGSSGGGDTASYERMPQMTDSTPPK